MFRLASFYQNLGNVPAAGKCASRGVEAVRQVGEPYELPHYRAIEARLEAAQGKFENADKLYAEADDLVEAMLVNVSSPGQESELIDTMSEIYVQHFALAATRLHNMPEAFRILRRSARAGHEESASRTSLWHGTLTRPLTRRVGDHKASAGITPE